MFHRLDKCTAELHLSSNPPHCSVGLFEQVLVSRGPLLITTTYLVVKYMCIQGPWWHFTGPVPLALNLSESAKVAFHDIVVPGARLCPRMPTCKWCQAPGLKWDTGPVSSHMILYVWLQSLTCLLKTYCFKSFIFHTAASFFFSYFNSLLKILFPTLKSPKRPLFPKCICFSP